MWSKIFPTFLCFLLMHSIFDVNGQEPLCNKFSFEEQLLEKVVRMEIKVENMFAGITKTQSEIQDLASKVNIELNLLSKERNDLASKVDIQLKLLSKDREMIKSDITVHKADTNKTLIDAAKKIENFVNDFERNIIRLSGDLRHFKNSTPEFLNVTSEVGQCADDPKYDCQEISSVFNVCADIANAKKTCRKWCRLCNLVDGSWGTWTSWSSCSVTCGKGDVIRSRSCTDPSPAHGGLPCSGNTTETNTCSLDACPVHGGWSSWKSWGSCSQSCGIGTQSRQRACDNPIPQLAGNHCFGDDNEYKACFARSCTDGDWSTWSSWSTCTGGLKFRNRTCDNPTPSQFGRGCVGDTTLDARCGPVAFTVNYLSGEYSGNTLIFKNVITDVGGGYSTTTGKFTCTIPGLYSFTLTLYTSSSSKVHCYIRKNSNTVALAVTGRGTQDISTSTSVYLSLSVGDVVYVYGCGANQYIDKSYASLFAGALL